MADPAVVREDQPLRCVRAGGDAGPPAGGRAPSGAGHDHGLRRLAGPVAIRDGGGAPEAGGLEGELPLALLEQRMLSASGGVRERPPAGRLAEDDVEPGRVAGDLEEHQRAPRGEQAPQVLERARDIRRRVDDVGRDHEIEGAGRQSLGQGVIGDVEWTRHAEGIGGELDLGLLEEQRRDVTEHVVGPFRRQDGKDERGRPARPRPDLQDPKGRRLRRLGDEGRDRGGEEGIVERRRGRSLVEPLQERKRVRREEELITVLVSGQHGRQVLARATQQLDVRLVGGEVRPESASALRAVDRGRREGHLPAVVP